MTEIKYGEYEGFRVLDQEQATQLIHPDVLAKESFNNILIEIPKSNYEYYYMTEFFRKKMPDNEFYSGIVSADVFKDEFVSEAKKNIYLYIPQKYLQSERDKKGFNYAAETAEMNYIRKTKSLEEMKIKCAEFLNEIDPSGKKELIVWNGKDVNKDYAYGEVIAADNYHIALKSGETADKVYTRIVSKTHMRRALEHEIMEAICLKGNPVRIDWIRSKDGRSQFPMIKTNDKALSKEYQQSREIKQHELTEQLEEGLRAELFLNQAIAKKEKTSAQREAIVGVVKDMMASFAEDEHKEMEDERIREINHKQSFDYQREQRELAAQRIASTQGSNSGLGMSK